MKQKTNSKQADAESTIRLDAPPSKGAAPPRLRDEKKKSSKGSSSRTHKKNPLGSPRGNGTGTTTGGCRAAAAGVVTPVPQDQDVLQVQDDDSDDSTVSSDGVLQQFEEKQEQQEAINAALVLVTREKAKLVEDMKRLTAESQNTEKKAKNMEKQLLGMKKTNDRLLRSNQALTNKLEECHAALRRSGKASKSEINKEIEKESKEFMKDVTFRSVKLVTSRKEGEVKKLTDRIYEGIKGKIGLDDPNSGNALSKDEFHRIYHRVLLSYHSTLRSGVQTNCQNAVKGTVLFGLAESTFSLLGGKLTLFSFLLLDWYTKHGFLPTIDDIKSVYDVCKEAPPAFPHHDSSEEVKNAWKKYQEKKELLVWYQDKYLPAAVGELSFGKQQRYYKKQIDTFELEGKHRHLVERSSEAYGLLVFENCYEKWKAIMFEKSRNPGWKAPAYDKDNQETHKFHNTKYSDPRGGNACGWKPEARTALREYMEAIKQFRDHDRSQGWRTYQKCLDWLRAAKGITDEDPVPRRSRKRQKVATTIPLEDFVEVDDESSVEEVVASDDDDEEEGQEGGLAGSVVGSVTAI